MIRQGYKIDLTKIARADGKYLYKQHIMDWLVQTSQTDELFGEFYHRTFKNGGACAFNIEYIDVFDAIRAVKEAGGIAVLAHPGQQRNYELIPELARAGLDGLELNHPSHDANDRETIRAYAYQYKLFMSGGSDFHGRYDQLSGSVGDYCSEESGILALCY